MNDLVPINGWSPDDEDQQGKPITSYDSSKVQDRLAVYRAVQGSDGAIDDLVGGEIEVSHIVVHPVSVTNRTTGEQMDTLRTVLVAPDGRRFSTLSPYVLKSIHSVMAIFERPMPFTPPIRFKVIKTKRKAGDGGYLQLDPVAESLEG
jgi:hypothetical protein